MKSIILFVKSVIIEMHIGGKICGLCGIQIVIELWWISLRKQVHAPFSRGIILTACSFHGDVDAWINSCKSMASSEVAPFHLTQPVEVLVRESRAVATALISTKLRLQYQGEEFDLEPWLHQIQRFEKVENEWKIVRLEGIFIQDSIYRSNPGQAWQLDRQSAEVIEKARPSCKYFTWHLFLNGRDTPADIPGYDNEKTWKPIANRNQLWLDTGKDE